MRQVFGIFLMIVGAFFAIGSPASLPILPLQPAPKPDDKKPDEKRRLFPILPKRPTAVTPAMAAKGGLTSPDGSEEILCDLPQKFHLRNRGGSDGAGLCVFCSLQHSSIWQHQWVTQDIFKWMWKRPGGGWPEKVDKVIAQMAKEQGKPVPAYVQFQDKDIEILKLACKTGRLPAITYNYSPTGNYRGQMIDHMVSLVHATDKWFAVLDNNFPEDIEWMDPGTFKNVYTRMGRRNGWSVVFLDPGPPPPPKN